MDLMQLDHSRRMHIEKSDSDVKMKKEICENLHFFSTCNFHDFFNFITDFSKIEEITVDPRLKSYIKRKLSSTDFTKKIEKKRRSLKDFTEKIEKKREMQNSKTQAERQQKKCDFIMLARKIQDIDLSSEDMIDIDSISDIKRKKRIDFFKKEYQDKFNSLCIILTVTTFFHESTDISSEDLFNEIDNIEITERKLNQWVIEKEDEIEDRTKLKISFIFNIIYNTISNNNSAFIIKKSQFPSITNFPDLTDLCIKSFIINGFQLNDHLYSISQCVVCSNLVSLSLINCGLKSSFLLHSDLIIHCINLESLELEKNYLTEIPPLPPKIKILSICDNQINDEGIKNISSLTNLQDLNLQNNKLKNIPILPFLKALFLDYNQIKNEGENDQLKFFSKLEWLSLSHNELTKPPYFIPHTLKILDISHNNIRGILQISFQGESNLSMLEISNNHFLKIDEISILFRYLNKDCEVRTDFGTYTIGLNDSHLSHDTNNEKKEILNDKMDID